MDDANIQAQCWFWPIQVFFTSRNNLAKFSWHYRPVDDIFTIALVFAGNLAFHYRLIFCETFLGSKKEKEKLPKKNLFFQKTKNKKHLAITKELYTKAF